MSHYRNDSGLLRVWQLESVKLVSSIYAVEEARRNLDLADQRKRLESLLVKLEVISLCREEMTLPKDMTIKEKDKPILLGAISVKADYLITGDLADFRQFYGKKIGNVIILPLSLYLSKRNKKKKSKRSICLQSHPSVFFVVGLWCGVPSHGFFSFAKGKSQS